MEIEVADFDLRNSLMSGACFRVHEEDDGSFTNILNDRVINIKQIGNKLIIKSNKKNNLKKTIMNYFDLYRDYNKINNEIINYDIEFKNIINKCRGYHILNQDSFEMCISYIISQNNNVKRISSSINKLCELYGEKILFEGKYYYLFPKYEIIKNLKEEDFSVLKVGFRSKYLVDFLSKYEELLDLNTFNTKEAFNKLLTVKGIGPKVASCILLFGYKRLDVFPIDTWVKKFVSTRYNIKNDYKTITKFTSDRFKEYTGLVIQYMYHYNRNVNKDRV